MQGVLDRREYWVSLKTSDRSKAIRLAAAAIRNKRKEIASEFQAKGGALNLWTVPSVDCAQDEAVDADVSTDDTSPRTGRYDRLNKAQLVALLEQNDRTKKLGLVWERGHIGTYTERDITVAHIDEHLSDKPAPWDNLVIEGDNYDALQWLRMTHLGRVKCIYVDPPYNTGNASWVYNDRYRGANDRFDQSTWLEFLCQRLVIARDLLTDDGVILLSINDAQRAITELMLADALPNLRISSLVWRTRNGSNADQGDYLSTDHEHILVASKRGFSFAGRDKSYAGYSNADNDPRGAWQAVPMKLGFSKEERPNLFYPLHDPDTGIYYPCNPDSVWRFATRANLMKGQRLQTQPVEDFIAQGRILFPTLQRVESYETMEALREAIDHKNVPLSGGVPILRHDLPDLSFWVGKRIGFGTPSRKLFKSELRRPTQPLSSWVSGFSDHGDCDGDTNHIVAGSYTEGSREVRSIFGTKAFNHAKPVSLIRELIRQSTSSNDLVLDFFAGSATTAQAVMELNAEDGGNRRFIMASSTEATEADPDKNLCRDVTAERIRLLNCSDEKKYANLATGFAYLRTKTVSRGRLENELTSSDAWTTLQALHGLPLTPNDHDQPWNVHETDTSTLVLVDRFDKALIDWLRPRAGHDVHLYAWAKGPFTKQLDEMQMHVLLVHAAFEQKRHVRP